MSHIKSKSIPRRLMLHAQLSAGALLFCCLAVPWASAQQETQQETQQEKQQETPTKRAELPISEVPDIVVAAARKAKPDVFFKSAERSFWNDEPIYIVKGTQMRKLWRVYVGSQGQIMHISSDWRDAN
jgi:hypothetical protein